MMLENDSNNRVRMKQKDVTEIVGSELWKTMLTFGRNFLGGLGIKNLILRGIVYVWELYGLIMWLTSITVKLWPGQV